MTKILNRLFSSPSFNPLVTKIINRSCFGGNISSFRNVLLFAIVACLITLRLFKLFSKVLFFFQMVVGGERER